MLPKQGTVLLLAVFLAVAAVPGAQAQAFDPVAGPYPYVQPDAAGDVFPHSTARFGDVTSLAFATTPEGAIVIQLKFVDLAMATGDLRYCVFFKVDGTSYQAGYRGQVVNGAPHGAATSCTWSSSGTSVGTPVWDAANDQVRVVIEPDKITGLAPGTVFTAISAQIGAVVPVAAQGSTNLYDSLTPSVEPLEFTYGAGGGAVDELQLTLDAPQTNATATPGGSASYSFSLQNNGTQDASVNLTAQELPEGFSATFEPASPVVAANSTTNVTVTVTVPADAAQGEIPFLVNVTGSGNFSLELPLVLTVEGPVPTGTTASGTTAATPTATGNETGAPQSADTPGPALALIVGSLAAAAVVLRRRRQE